MVYLIGVPLAIFMLSPLWTAGWGGSYVGDKVQRQEIWDAGSEGESGHVRTAEGTVGPPRN